MTKTPEELEPLYERLLQRTPLRPREPRNHGHSVSDFAKALKAGSTPEATRELRAELDATVLKL
jgi:hypothetical protein